MAVTSGQAVRGYELQELLGVGGFGAVYRAYQPLVKRDVAVKIILPQFANRPDFIRSFETEAQLVARLEHLHIVPLYDYWREPNSAYLVMRWLRGGSLRHRLQWGPLDLDTAATFLEQTAGALAVAHRRGIVHRDIKPDNILLDEDGNFFLSDFGIAQDVEKPRTGEDDDSEDIFAGSLTYTSPEQIRGDAATPETDIYSLGILLYEVLSGEHPFRDAAPAALVFKHLSERVPLLRDHFPEFSPDIDSIVQRATSKSPDDRFPDAVTMAAAFRRAVKSSKRRTISMESAIIPSATMDTTPTSFDSLLPEIETPYKGLRPFEEADSAEFYGREALIEQLLARLGEADANAIARFLAIVGPSGSGKSSAVKAGLIPALRNGALPGSKNWFIVEMIPGAQPFHELEQALLSVAVNPPTNLSNLLSQGDSGLLLALGQILPPENEGLLFLYIDQLEEIFTMIDSEDMRARFLRILWTAVVAPESRLRLVVSLRADFYDRPLVYTGFGDLMRKRTEVVLPLTLEELQRAIVDPALHVGVDLEPGLVLAIMADVSEQPGALPLLQYALTELFERREGHLLRLQAYEGIGGVLGALAKRAEELYLALSAGGQSAARQLFLRLVTPGEGSEATRRRVLRSELFSLGTDESVMASVIDIFGRYRLLTFDRDPVTRAPTLEVAHEALIRQWQRLRDWLEASREDLRQQRRLLGMAEEWRNAACDASFLARGSRLEQFETWAQTTQLALNQIEQQFLQASVEARESLIAAETARRHREVVLEKRSRDRLRSLALVLLIATIGALGLSAVAINQSDIAERSAMTATYAQGVAYNAAADAQTQAAIAQINAVEARSLALAASSHVSLQDGNSDLATLLALEANRLASPMQARLALAEAAYDPGTVRVMRAHLAPVTDVAISPSQRIVATVSRDGFGYLWDITTGNLIHQLRGHQDRLTSVAFSPDGETILTGSWDGTARLWDTATGREIKRFEHNAGVLAVAFSPGGRTLVTATNNGSVVLWDVATGQQRRRFSGHTGAVTSVAFSPNSQFIASGSMDRTIRIWNVSTGRELYRISGHTDRITSVDFHPNGRMLASGSSDDTVRVWDIETGAQLAIFSSHTDSVSDVRFDPTGRTLLSASWDGSLYLWDLQTGQPLHHFIGHSAAVTSIAISADGHLAASGSDDQTARLWAIDAGSDLQRFRYYVDEISAVAVSSDSRRAAVGGANNSFVEFNVSTGAQIQRFFGHQGSILSLAFRPHGHEIVSSATDGTVIEWNVDTGEALGRFEGHTDPVSSLDFSPDGRYLVTGSWDKTLILWNAETREEIRRFGDDHDDRVLTVRFAADGQEVISGSNDGKLVSWNVNTGEKIFEFADLDVPILQIAANPNGQTFMTASGDGVVRLWDIATGALVRDYIGHRSAVLTIAITPDGTTALSGSRDRSLILWDIASGAQIHRFEGHTDAVTSAVFIDDGMEVLTGSRDKTLRLWRTLSLDSLMDWMTHNRYVPALDCNDQVQFSIEALCDSP